MFRPLFEASNFSVMPKHDIRSGVVGLDFPIRPTAIAWLIIAIIVYAVYGVSVWSLSHISQESLIVIPFLTDGDSATSVVLVILLIGIIASLSYVLPNRIGSSFVGKTMRRGNFSQMPAGDFGLPATTRFANSALKLVRSHNALNPTFAPAKKAGAVVIGSGSNNRPAVKFKSDHGISFRGNKGIIYKPLEIVNIGGYYGQ